MRATPLATMFRGDGEMTDLPRRINAPDDGNTSPDTRSASRLWPLPDTPAMPVMVPAWSCNDTLSRVRFFRRQRAARG